MKKIQFFILIVGLCYTEGYSQKDPKVFTSTDIVWCGLDYSQARFIGSSDFDPQLLHTHFLDWNDLMLAESEKFNFKEAYQKETQINDLSVVTRRNALVNPEEVIIDERYKIPTEKLHEVVSDYNLDIEEGLGLVYIVESLNKRIQSASIYLVFFDIADKKILWALRYDSPAAGFGMRNYWARPVYEIIKASTHTYKKAKRKAGKRR